LLVLTGLRGTLLMAGKGFAWIRINKSDKVRMEAYFRRQGVTNHSVMFKKLLGAKK